MTVMFLAGMAWGFSIAIVILALAMRAGRKHVMSFVVGAFGGSSPASRVYMLALLYERYCVHCGTEQANPYLTCPCPLARATRTRGVP
jgi:hypothetical protein